MHCQLIGLGYMQSYSISNAIADLLHKIEVSDSCISSGSSVAAATTKFEQTFGCTIQDIDTIQRLIDAKTITIGRLIELMPEGTVDPTPFTLRYYMLRRCRIDGNWLVGEFSYSAFWIMLGLLTNKTKRKRKYE